MFGEHPGLARECDDLKDRENGLKDFMAQDSVYAFRATVLIYIYSGGRQPSEADST